MERVRLLIQQTLRANNSEQGEPFQLTYNKQQDKRRQVVVSQKEANHLTAGRFCSAG